MAQKHRGQDVVDKLNVDSKLVLEREISNSSGSSLLKELEQDVDERLRAHLQHHEEVGKGKGAVNDKNNYMMNDNLNDNEDGGGKGKGNIKVEGKSAPLRSGSNNDLSGVAAVVAANVS